MIQETHRIKNRCGTAFAILLIFLSLNSTLLLARQAPDIGYTWLHYDIENGLPQNSVATITSDSSGYLWFATQSGLVRFDGSRFMVFNSSNVPGFMRSDRIRWSGNDLDGRIYFRDEFFRLFRQNGPCSFEPVAASEGETIFINDNGGISDQTGTEIFEFPLQHLKSDTALFEKMNSTDNSVFNLIVINRREAYSYYKDLDDKYVLSYFDDGLFSILRNDDFIQNGQLLQFSDTLCFVNRNGSAAFYVKGKLVHFTKPSGNFIYNSFSSMVTQSFTDAGIFITSGHNYLYDGNSLFEIVQDNFFEIKKILLFQNLPCKFIASVYKIPGTSVLAIGTYTDGLYLIYPKSFGHLYYGKDPSDFVNTSYALMERNGEIVTSNYRYNYRTGRFAPFQGTFRSRLFFRDKEDYLWYHEANIITKTKDYIHASPVDTVMGEMKGISYLRPDSVIFFMGANEIGLIERGIAKPMVSLPGGTSSLAGQADALFTTYQPYSKGLFIGTTRGLYEFDMKTKALTEVDSSTQVNIRTVYEDKEGHIWIGTYGQGLYLLKDERLQKLPLDKKGNLSIVHYFVEDAQGYFWIPTNNGLYKTLKKDLLRYVEDSTTSIYYHAFDKLDGLPFYEFNGGSMPNLLKLDGRIYLPTMKGLVSFAPAEVYMNLPVKAIQVDFVELNGRKQDDISKLQVPHGFSSLVIHLSSPYFGNPDNLQIEYMIEGLNRNWRALENRKIEFNALPKGKYRIVARKNTGFGENAHSYSVLSFEVLPAFYETIWFKAAIVLAIVALIWLFMKIRYRYIVAQNQRLEKEVRERTVLQGLLISELKESNQQLKESEENLFNTISEKDRLISVLVHDLRSPLRFLKNNTSYLSRNWNNHSPAESEKLVHEVDDAAKQIHYLTEELMLWIATRANKHLLDIREYALKDVIDELADLYNDIIVHSGNRLETMVPGDIKLRVDKLIFKTVLRNLLDNANKNTEEGAIRIGAKQTSTDTIVTLSDTGTGMSEEMLHDINEYLDGSTGYLSQNSQFGHKIIRDFATLLDARISYRNSEIAGLVIDITLKR